MHSGFVAIVGRPNSGKSTLLNAILGTELSIVTPKAQTTRERVLGILTEKAGQIVFIDTPGIHRARDGGINEYMVNEAKEALDSPNLVWYLVDPNSGLFHEETVIELLAKSKSPIFLLMTKADAKINGALQDEVLEKLRKENIPVNDVFAISGRRKTGLDVLLKKTWERIPEGPLYYPDEDQISDRPTRFFVAEKIREQLFVKLGEEIPYSCAVEIQKFDEKVKPPRIEAVIHVERDSQKGMVVGKGGTKIKEIGQAARIKIEEFLGQKVFLGLQVKLLKDWTRNAEVLKRLGYNLPKENKKTKK